MMERTFFTRATLVAATLVAAPALAQPQELQRVGYVTVVGGTGAGLTGVDQAELLTAASLAPSNNKLVAGHGLRTGADGTAVVLLPGFETVVYLEPESELLLPAKSASDGGATLAILAGRVSVVPKPRNNRWLVVSVHAGGRAAGYTLSQGASLFIEAGEDHSTVSVRLGSAIFFPGVAGPDVLDASGQPANRDGVLLGEGQQISVQAQAQAAQDPEAGVVVPRRLGDDVLAFAVARTGLWLDRAEKGDFTPVKTASRGAPELLSAAFEPRLVFDQARPVLAQPARGQRTTTEQPLLSPTQTLARSSFPGDAIGLRKVQGSLIVQGKTGSLVINSFATLPIQLDRK